MPILGTEVVRNGKAYDSGDVDMTIDGELFPGVAKVVYATNQEHQLNFSLKNDATSWSKGKKTPTGSMELYMEDVVRLQRKGGGSLLNLKPFYTVVTFTNEDQEVVVDRVYWKFQSEGRTVDGAMGLKQEFEMFTIKITMNV